MAASDFVHNADGVNFQTLPASKAVNHEDFVEGILERINRGAIFKKL